MLPRGVLEAGAAAKDLRSADTLRRSAMGADDLERYIRHPLSCVGDGLSSTSFRSPAGKHSLINYYETTKSALRLPRRTMAIVRFPRGTHTLGACVQVGCRTNLRRRDYANVL